MKYSALIAILTATVPAAFGAGATLHLLQRPAMNKTEIVFSYAGDLWSVNRQGGVATRLTSGTGVEKATVVGARIRKSALGSANAIHDARESHEYLVRSHSTN